ncbi:glycosyltransferase family 4 protein [Alkalihalobacterium alkalinitrilicum]|uniref:glycosyltransferase family 4 protein n=1 Tax=Alkalihalobacterium alkalinitrilicum TaxID=427920 RepID=UPI00099536B2|nr:glycosyltransferase family 4 protein [Alkalihalobacterium alkalinitrilicum]
MKKVCVITTVHHAYDGRIYHKQCKSLAKNGYSVDLIAPEPDDREEQSPIRLIPIEKPKSKLKRIVNTLKVIKLARKTKADLYHFHDPELLMVGVILRLITRKPVIFDVHEHYPNAIMSKPYLSKRLKPIIRSGYEMMEKLSLSILSGVIYTTTEIGERYKKYKSCKIENYPLKTMFTQSISEQSKDPNQLIYLGGMTPIRGVKELVGAFALVVKDKPTAKLTFVGFFESSSFESEIKAIIKKLEIEDHIEFKGRVPYEEIENYLSHSAIGIIPYLPVPNHLVCLPNKLFEYMASGTAVVASDFPHYREVVEQSRGGIVVDPTNVQNMAKEVTRLLSDPDQLKEIQKNAQKAFNSTYNWEKEEKKLLTFYNEVLSS